jgi:DNA-binding MarR family transcriptional regulator
LIIKLNITIVINMTNSNGASVATYHRVPAHLGRLFHQLCQVLVAEAQAAEGLVSPEYAALASLDEEPGLDQKRLGEAIGVDRNTIGIVVERLEQRGLLTREVDKEDRRARILRLTSEGTALRRRLRPRMLAANARAIEALTEDEAKTLLALLHRAVEHHATLISPGAERRMRRIATNQQKDTVP